MFDPTTENLIRSAPQFKGLDLDNLPKLFTRTYARIVSARIQLRNGPTNEDKPIVELRRIAAIHEAYAALLPDQADRAAAAYVAASAHHTVSYALGTKSVSHIGIESISPDICSTLLFLLADAPADAAEAAKRINPGSKARPVEVALLNAIENIARGRLGEIVDKKKIVPSVDEVDQDFGLLAFDALCTLLLKGITNLAHQLRGLEGGTTKMDNDSRADVQFKKVRSLASRMIEHTGVADKKLLSLYPGPLHLANLLIGLEKCLLETALSRIPTPDGIDKNDWQKMVQRMAQQRPYLWRNHRNAVDEGYLDRGVSSAISFPTGGGKSTLAHLKIATALLRKEKVIFLASTHALVGQTKRSLEQIFKDCRIRAVDEEDEESGVGTIVIRNELIVMTPERCLMMLSIDSSDFAKVGLIVFDECHLLHPSSENRCRRALDAMLAVLNLTSVAQKADLLMLSAMMKNTQEIAGWISQITERKCLTLDLNWKPTRQVRGCVVYSSEEISALNDKLTKARSDHPNHINPPKIVNETLLAQPFGFFGLHQTWLSKNRPDYALLALLTEKLCLSSGRRGSRGWKLKANVNNTSSALASAAAIAGMKTLVFVHQPSHCESCVRNYPTSKDTNRIVLNKEEQTWRRVVEEEMGDASFCYMELDSDSTLLKNAASHHSLLLPEERELHESLFRRKGGISVLFATSTLAQGMNLPSEVVIISGNNRFDQQVGMLKNLEAHELLNAAGRAGRAGEGAQGIVLLVPSKIIGFDDKKSEISMHWNELKAVFEQADQCLDIEDPLTVVLDSIHRGDNHVDADYLLNKLPLAETGKDDDPAEALLNRSLFAYHARHISNDDSLDSKIRMALEARVDSAIPLEDRWIVQISSSTGLPIALLQQIVTRLDAGVFSGTAVKIVGTLFDWLDENPGLTLSLFRRENLEALFGDDYKKGKDDEERGRYALPHLRKLTMIWMSGEPLCALENAFPSRKKIDQTKGRNARLFALRFVPELAFLASLPSRLLVARQHSSEEKTRVPPVLATLSRIVREGCDSPDSLAMRLHLTRSVSRVAARNHYDTIRKYIRPGHPDESFEETLQRIRNAYGISTFKDHGD